MAFPWIQKIGLWLAGGAGYRQPGKQSGEAINNGGAPSVPVSVDSAMSLSAVWACVRLIAETVSSLPIKVYDVDPIDGTRTLNNRHPLAVLMNGRLNQWQTRQEFFETITFQLSLLGNCYAEKQYNQRRELIGLLPLMSSQMVTDVTAQGRIAHTYMEGGRQRVYDQNDIWHVKLFGNGIVGLSPLSFARASIGIGQAAEKSVTDIYRNGGKASGVLSIDRVLKDDQRAAIKKNFDDISHGSERRLFVLEAGMDFQQVSLSPQDIELLQSRRFQIEDICRFWGVPSVLVNDTQASSTWGSGIQQIVEGWYKLGLRPYLERFESSIKQWLVRPEDRSKIDIEFDFDVLLRLDPEKRYRYLKEGIQGGLLTPDEGRRKEGLPAMPGGDKLYMQQQMTPIDMLPVTKNDGGRGNAP